MPGLFYFRVGVASGGAHRAEQAVDLAAQLRGLRCELLGQFQNFSRRIVGHSLMRVTGWIYPKMSRLPRTVAEVLAAFDRVKPKMRQTFR